LISRFSTVVCAPVFTRGHGLETEVLVGPEDGLKHPSWIGCDGLISFPKSRLTDFVGSLPPEKLSRLSQALRIALDVIRAAEKQESAVPPKDRSADRGLCGPRFLAMTA
jgi:mRNA interferase MazF